MLVVGSGAGVGGTTTLEVQGVQLAVVAGVRKIRGLSWARNLKVACAPRRAQMGSWGGVSRVGILELERAVFCMWIVNWVVLKV